MPMSARAKRPPRKITFGSEGSGISSSGAGAGETASISPSVWAIFDIASMFTRIAGKLQRLLPPGRLEQASPAAPPAAAGNHQRDDDEPNHRAIHPASSG